MYWAGKPTTSAGSDSWVSAMASGGMTCQRSSSAMLKWNLFHLQDG